MALNLVIRHQPIVLSVVNSINLLLDIRFVSTILLQLYFFNELQYSLIAEYWFHSPLNSFSIYFGNFRNIRRVNMSNVDEKYTIYLIFGVNLLIYKDVSLITKLLYAKVERTSVNVAFN